MLFKMDLWNPRQITEEADISKLLQTAATDLYAKVKSADNSSHQDMVRCLRFKYFWGRVLNFIQSEARNHLSLFN